MSFKHNIRLINAPQAYTLESKIFIVSAAGSIGLQLATNIGIAMGFGSSFFIIFCIKERVTGAKHLQCVSGVKLGVLWLVSYIWDLIVFCVVSIAVIITFASYNEEGFRTYAELGE